MFRANGYCIVETKEDFLENWDSRWERWRGQAMPRDFDIETATFPMALIYCESFDSHCCGSYSFTSMEKAISVILTEYDNMIKNITNEKNLLETFAKTIDKTTNL